MVRGSVQAALQMDATACMHGSHAPSVLRRGRRNRTTYSAGFTGRRLTFVTRRDAPGDRKAAHRGGALQYDLRIPQPIRVLRECPAGPAAKGRARYGRRRDSRSSGRIGAVAHANSADLPHNVRRTASALPSQKACGSGDEPPHALMKLPRPERSDHFCCTLCGVHVGALAVGVVAAGVTSVRTRTSSFATGLGRGLVSSSQRIIMLPACCT